MTGMTSASAAAAPLPAWLRMAAPIAAMTVGDVANALGVTKVQVHRMLQAGKLPAPQHLTQPLARGSRVQPYRLIWSKAQMVQVWREFHPAH